MNNMHFIVAWRPHAEADSADANAVDAAVREALAGESWTEPLPRFAIVRASSETEYEVIRARLHDATQQGAPMSMVMSPVIPDVADTEMVYTGWLSLSAWDEINRRTIEPELWEELKAGHRTAAHDANVEAVEARALPTESIAHEDADRE